MIKLLTFLPLIAAMQAGQVQIQPAPQMQMAVPQIQAKLPMRSLVLRGMTRSIAQQIEPTPDSPGLPTLRWRNGETLQGNIAQASDTALSWSCTEFRDPLEINWSALDRVTWPLRQVHTKEPFCFSLRNGSFLYGDLVSIGADFVDIKSSRHGNVGLARKEVISIRRISRDNLVYNGPCGTIGWHMVESGTAGFMNIGSRFPDFTTPLAIGPDGKLLFRNWNRAAFCDAKLPDRLDISFQLSSTVVPEFEMSFGEDIRSALSLETWDQELVLEQGNSFKPVLKVEDNDHAVRLHILWDKPALKCSVYGDDGTLMETWDVPPHISTFEPHLVLYNKGLNLSVDSLQIRSWDGKTVPQKISPSEPTVQLASGRRIAVQVLSENNGTVSFGKSGELPSQMALDEIDELDLNPTTDAPEKSEASLTYNDGSTVYGHLVSISDKGAFFQTPFTSEPLRATLDEARALFVRVAPFPSPKQDLSSFDKLKLGSVSLHGNVLWSGDSSFRWKPVGAAGAARPSETLGFEVVQNSRATVDPGANSTLFYMSSGDIIPGKLDSIDHKGIEFESTLTTTKAFSNQQVNAIQFLPSPDYKIKGFDDPAWKILKGDSKSVLIDGNKLELGPDSAIACPINFKEFSFNYSTKQFCGLRMRLFTSEKPNSRSMNIVWGSYGSQIYSYQETPDGHGNEDQVQTAIKWGQDVAIKVVFNENRVELFVNGVSVIQAAVEASECGGSEMILEPFSSFGNEVSKASLSKFSCVPGASWIPEFDPEVKKEMITVPRMNRDHPPSHLLVGANGDLLRGEIDAATDSAFQFHCGMETVDIPRDRVKTIIILKPVDKNKTNAAVDDAISPSKILDEHVKAFGRLRMSFGRIDLSSLISYLSSQWITCTIHLPDKPLIGQIAFSGQSTLRGVLDRICASYGVQYRVDKDGSIYLETEDSITKLPTKSYWVNPDKFPKAKNLQELLVSKGISVPKDAYVEYDDASGLLSMANSNENITKLSLLLDSDFGGTLGSPTNWFSLASGGKISLAATKFAPDFVEGQNPLYGTCKIPTADIVEIRSTPFPAANRTLGSWRLVDAPEPVIPQNGGDSPLLGKPAITFDADLLDGGKFSLSEEKGKIVVLDFWATWCGPCTKALPEVISTVSAFPTDKVELVSVNQGEPPEQITRFLKARGLNVTVALDPEQKTGTSYGIEAIPRTIIISQDGTIVWDQTGYDPDNGETISNEIKKLLLGNNEAQKDDGKPSAP